MKWARLLRTMKNSLVQPSTLPKIYSNMVELKVFSRNIQLLRFFHHSSSNSNHLSEGFSLILMLSLFFSIQGSVQGNTRQQPAVSNGASADSLMSVRTEPVLCFSSKPAHSTISFSGVTAESTAGDFQDCGASSMKQLSREPQPWCPPISQDIIASSHATTRNNAVMRYKEKKKARK